MREYLEEMIQSSSPEVELMLLLQRLNQLRLTDVPKTNFDLSFSQIEILRVVGLNPGFHLQDVAAEVGLTPPSVSVSIRQLEDAGWLERQDDPNDGRASCFYVTEKTKEAFKITMENQMEIIKIFLKELTTEEQKQLTNLLEKAISGMEAQQQNIP